METWEEPEGWRNWSETGWCLTWSSSLRECYLQPTWLNATQHSTNHSINQLIATYRDLHSSSNCFPTRLGGHTSSAANDSPCGVHYRENISYLGQLARRRFFYRSQPCAVRVLANLFIRQSNFQFLRCRPFSVRTPRSVRTAAPSFPYLERELL